MVSGVFQVVSGLPQISPRLSRCYPKSPLGTCAHKQTRLSTAHWASACLGEFLNENLFLVVKCCRSTTTTCTPCPAREQDPAKSMSVLCRQEQAHGTNQERVH